jgi:hypothetical protein
MKERRKDSKFRKKEIGRKKSYNKTTKIKILIKLRNLGKKPLKHTENQILKRYSNHLRQPPQLTENEILKR